MQIASVATPIEIVPEGESTHRARLLHTSFTQMTIEVAGVRPVMGRGLLRQAANQQDATLERIYRAILRAAEKDLAERRGETARTRRVEMTRGERYGDTVDSLRGEADTLDAEGRTAEAGEARRTAETVVLERR